MGADLGASFRGQSPITGDEIFIKADGEYDNATILLSSSGEFPKGLALKSGGAGDVKIPYLNSDTIAEISGEAVLAEQIIIDDTAGGRARAKVAIGGSVNRSKILDRDGNPIDSDFTDHVDMKRMRFVSPS